MIGRRPRLPTKSTRESTAAPTRWLFVLVVLVYGNSLDGGFHFDDWHVIQDNPAIRSLSAIPRYFTDPHALSILRENSDLRPVLMATFALNHALTGLDAWSYHTVNVLLHFAVVAMVFRLVRDHLWLGSAAPFVAATAAALMAVHPLTTEAVDYVSARSVTLVTLFYVLAFDLACRGRRWRAVGTAGLAMLTKAIALTLPLVVLAHAMLARGRREQGSGPTSGTDDDHIGTTIAMLTLVAIGGVAYRLLLLPPAALGTTHDPAVTSWIYALTSTTAYLHYLRQFLWPDGLAVDRLDFPLATTLTTPSVLLGLGVLAAGSWLAWQARHHRPALSFGWLWFVVTLLPEQSVFPLAEPVNDHRPYLALPGLVIVAAVAFHALGATMRGAQSADRVRRTLAATVVLALGTVTIARNRVWADDYRLWKDATVKAPGNARAWLNAGHAAMSAGRLDEAERLFAAGHRLAPCYAFIQLNQSALATRRMRFDDAIAFAREAESCQPSSALAPRYLGEALERAGRSAEAAAAYRRALALDERSVDAWRALGRIAERDGQWADAVRAYERAVALDPTDIESHVAAGVLLRIRLADPLRAVPHFRAVLARDPDHYGARFQLAVALAASGNEAQAREEWHRFETLARALGDVRDLALAPPGLGDDGLRPR